MPPQRVNLSAIKSTVEQKNPSFQRRPRAKRKWKFDDNGHPDPADSVVPPLGFSRKDHTVVERGQDPHHQAKLAASAMAVATSPGKQIFMTVFVLWMTGTSLQIFSLMALVFSMMQPLTALFNVSAAFARYKDSGIDLIRPKLIYIALALAWLACPLHKANSMGLLPSLSDLTSPPLVLHPGLEFSSGSLHAGGIVTANV